MPPLRFERKLLHLGLVFPLPPSRARTEISEVGIARKTAPPPGESRVLPGLPGVGRHGPLRLDAPALQILGGEIPHRSPAPDLPPRRPSPPPPVGPPRPT